MISPSEFTLKKALVDPDSKQPYLILVCFARSSADSIGDSIRSTTTRTGLLIYEKGELDKLLIVNSTTFLVH